MLYFTSTDSSVSGEEFLEGGSGSLIARSIVKRSFPLTVVTMKLSILHSYGWMETKSFHCNSYCRHYSTTDTSEAIKV